MLINYECCMEEAGSTSAITSMKRASKVVSRKYK
jgi:hypothetical protein